MDLQDYTASQASTTAKAAYSALNSTHTPHTLASLPNDVLLQVWAHLEDPLPLSRVNKRFNKLSQDTLWRARWLMQRYPRYLVVFEAIARPKIFTPALLERILRLGAPLSRNIAQLIQLLWNATVRRLMSDQAEAHEVSSLRNIRWGRRISFSAYAALMLHASSLYGDEINTEPEELDSCVFERWSGYLEEFTREEESGQGELGELRGKVRRMFRDQNFMPLPIAILRYHDEGPYIYPNDKSVLGAIVDDSELATFILRSGYELTVKETEELFQQWPCFTQSPEKLVASAERLRDASRVVNISVEYARQVFGPPRTHLDNLNWHLRLVRREVLLHLNTKSALPFRLEDVITEDCPPVPMSED